MLGFGNTCNGNFVFFECGLCRADGVGAFAFDGGGGIFNRSDNCAACFDKRILACVYLAAFYTGFAVGSQIEVVTSSDC
jgi:hypothetical protein